MYCMMEASFSRKIPQNVEEMGVHLPFTETAKWAYLTQTRRRVFSPLHCMGASILSFRKATVAGSI
jgi:hypothetical protein